MTKSDQITLEFINNPDADVNKLAKKYKTAPSYVYKMRARAMEQTANTLRDSEQDHAMDALVYSSQALGGWQITTSTGNVATPLEVQIAGSHYKGKKIQPVEYIHANNLNFLEGCIVKRITRWRDKDGFQDLEKIKHEVDLLIEMEKKYANK
jgi:hypothetical protein